MKDRNISTLEYFEALQREYICLEIRSKIYISKDDKEYFKKLMQKKEDIILGISDKNNLPDIVTDDGEYMKVWRQIVPKFGFPKMIYNIAKMSDAQLSFPYSGSCVRIDNDKYGMVKFVSFQKNTVTVVLSGEKEEKEFERNKVTRLNHLETDEYYYFYPGNSFNVEDVGIGFLHSYDMNKKEVVIDFDNKKMLTLPNSKVSRIL